MAVPVPVAVAVVVDVQSRDLRIVVGRLVEELRVDVHGVVLRVAQLAA